MKEKRKKIKKKLVKKYRLVVLTEDSFEEKFSFKLTRLNVFVFGGVFSVFLIALTSGLIVYTPLKEYIPGFESPQLKKDAISLNFQLDSIEQKMHALELYTESMKPILIGDKAVEIDELPYVTKEGESVYQSGIANNDSIHNKLARLYSLLEQKNKTIESLKEQYKGFEIDTIDGASSIVAITDEEGLSDEELESLESSRLDSVFREKVEREERFSIFGYERENATQVFVVPTVGNITQEFSVTSKHYAIDVATAKEASVKAITDGVVIFAEWSIETGYVIVLLHTDNFVSVYKHNSKINVSQGELVKAGQVIANVGSTGELSTGPHLHLEMWKDGYPVDPTNFMKF
ncbi:murein DD-endopeptidase MepM/ murein hydrolase activator NlpD [Wenyingzhuangia heitensis]|uniref:Murein DD-endopeptidase MepM/ murein hydrolase activator NlpD n=1 Tax=Wenyingzhuangia heitensis TaxID=1487859 RepID=A0ABX0U435_9FLAO|nr:M23 family metallopeptidase [Wenyingzhuangia heitensis]NIJ43604.1 murein DD-endopeptidase MepM/ murein hydrolase activator NlpD [Wenyingzhuangia heitensis]